MHTATWTPFIKIIFLLVIFLVFTDVNLFQSFINMFFLSLTLKTFTKC